MGWGSNWHSYPKSTPKRVKGGIKAQSARGKFGESWWAKRWIAVLESFHIGARLSRGRSYARQGQVVSIDVEKGRVVAAVQGSRAAPYTVNILVKALTPEEWRKIGRRLSSQALFTAKLLSGEMPHEMEAIFTEAGLSLFPGKLKDLQTYCSCPDWSNPCKHLAAVFYLLGEEFDRDPFLMLRLRGLERDELVGLLGCEARVEDTVRHRGESPDGGSAASGKRRRGRPAQPEKSSGHGTPRPVCDAASRSESSDDLASFWTGCANVAGDGWKRPSLNAALLRQAGAFSFWRGEMPLFETLAPKYREASERAAALLEEASG